MKSILTFLSTLLAASAAFAGLDLLSVSVNPTAAASGQTVTGAVQLTEACRNSAGCLISMSSSNTSAASVPASVVVANGGMSNTFTFTAGAMSSQTSVTITGTFGGKSKIVTMTVGSGAPAALCAANSTRSCAISNGSGQQTCDSTGSAWGTCQALSCNAGFTLQNGSCTASQTTSSGTLNIFQMTGDGTAGSVGVASGGAVNIYTSILNSCQNAAGCVVNLSSSNPAVLAVPATMTISNTALGNTIYLSAGQVSTSTSVSVTASAGGVSKTLTTTIFAGAPPPSVSSMYMYGDGGYSPVSGQITYMQVNMYSTCPVGGCLVSMSSSNSVAAPVPSQVLVPEGQSFVRFPVQIGTVSAKTNVIITTNFQGQSYNTGSMFSVRPPWPRNADGSIAMVANTQRPGSTSVQVNSLQAARAWENALDSMMYDDVDINLYNQCQAAFAGNGQLIATSQPTQMALVSNGFNYYYYYNQNYRCQSGYISWLQTISTTVGSVIAPQGFPVSVCLERAAPTNIAVALSSSTSAARVPTSVTIFAGQTCASFNVTTNVLNDGTAGVDAKISATLNGLRINVIKTVYYY